MVAAGPGVGEVAEWLGAAGKSMSVASMVAVDPSVGEARL